MLLRVAPVHLWFNKTPKNMATQKKINPAHNHPMVISYNSYDPGTNQEASQGNGTRTDESQFHSPGFLDLLKRETEKLIEAVVSKAGKEVPESVFVRSKDQIINLKLTDILWVEAYGDYVNFFTEKTRYIIHSTMKAIGQKLPAEQFTRVHRSFIIRTDKIELIEESLIQIGKKLIPIGESYRDELFAKLNVL
jgi:hypothetical protein